jgi:hypothetical protein
MYPCRNLKLKILISIFCAKQNLPYVGRDRGQTNILLEEKRIVADSCSPFVTQSFSRGF